jgi:predicted ribosomally synthesized peptide with nif11-like leader
MSDQVAKFFADVYQNRSLQGALHYALAKANPDVVVEIAKQKGYKFSGAELESVIEGGKGELSDAALDGAVGGALSLSAAKLSTSALKTSFWNSLVRPGGLAATFGLTIPGPSFVQVATPADRELPEVDKQEPENKVSAVDAFAALNEE